MEGDKNWRCALEVETLDCPICTDPLSTPVYQCENGHHLCSACSKKIGTSGKGCPSCSQPTGRIRCLAVEKILESVLVPCKHGAHGCQKMLRYNQRDDREDHEKETCLFQPFPCPLPLCSHEGPLSAFSSHVEEAHFVNRYYFNVTWGIESQSFSMSTEQNCAILERRKTSTSSDADAHGTNGLVVVHLEDDGNSLGDWFFCSAYGVHVEYELEVKLTSSDVVRKMKATAHDFSRVSERERGGMFVERLLVPSVAWDGAPRRFDVKVTVNTVIVATPKMGTRKAASLNAELLCRMLASSRSRSPRRSARVETPYSDPRMELGSLQPPSESPSRSHWLDQLGRLMSSEEEMT